MTREFLIDSTLAVAVFLIRAFEERKNVERVISEDDEEEVILNYDESEAFNDFWDEIYGEFEMAEYSYTASEILFNVDYQAYETEYKAFNESVQEEKTDGEGL